MACRYPGDTRTPEDLWRLLERGVDAITPFPVNRGWDLGAIYDPNPEASGRSYVREGGFLHDADQFDPLFFGLSEREAMAIDPQQRLLLEVSWELFEGARIVPATLAGSATGVFVGVLSNDYGARFLQAPPAGEGLDGYLAIGSSASVASGRISYTYGFHGP